MAWLQIHVGYSGKFVSMKTIKIKKFINDLQEFYIYEIFL